MEKERENLKIPGLSCLASNLISTLVEEAKLSQEPVGQLLQEIWRALDAMYHQGIEASELPALRMNWIRAQVLLSLSSDLMENHTLLELIPVMTEIMEKSL